MRHNLLTTKTVGNRIKTATRKMKIIEMNSTFAQNVIMDRVDKKRKSTILCGSYDVHGDSYSDYIDEPYGDYYDTNSEEPH